MRATEKIAKDVQRTFDRCLELERKIQEAHADGDWERAWAAAIELRPLVRRSGTLVGDFCKSVRRSK